MAEKPGSRRFARPIKLAVFSLVPAIVLLVIAETAARISISRRALTVTDSTTGRSIYTLQIGKWPWSHPSTTPLNSLGFPDDEFPSPEQKRGCTHLVFAGDSYVLGDGVDRDSNFVEIVRRRASARHTAPCIRIFNIAVRGTTIDRQADAIRRTLDRLQPDVIILGQYQNDLTDLNAPGAILDPNRNTDGSKRPGDSVRVRARILQSKLIKLLTYRLFAVMIERGTERDVLRHWSVMADTSRRAEAERFQETYSLLYADLATTLSARRIAFGVVIIPSKLDLLARRYPEEAFFVELATRHNVPYLRLFPVLDAQRSPFAFLMYDGHLNERGNRLVAEEVYRWLFEPNPAHFPPLRRP